MEILIYLPTDDQSITIKYMHSFLQRPIDSILLKLKVIVKFSTNTWCAGHQAHKESFQ